MAGVTDPKLTRHHCYDCEREVESTDPGTIDCECGGMLVPYAD